jgi:ribosomal protein L1
MNYQATLKKRIQKIVPHLKIKGISLYRDSFEINIESSHINPRSLEQQLREELSMPGLVVTTSSRE